MKKFAAVIVSLLMACSLFAQAQINDDNAFLIYAKLKNAKFTENDYACYGAKHHSKEYTANRKNEFEWEDTLARYKAELDAKVEAVDVNAEYQIVTSCDLGDYDFTNLGFKVAFNEGIYFDVARHYRYWGDGAKRGKDVLAPSVALVLTGLEKYNFVPMEKDKAKAFLASRTNSYKPRTVTIQIIYTVEPCDSAAFKSVEQLYENNDYHPLCTKIKKINVYDTENGKEELLGEIVIK